jgi:hypothetical protein
MSSTIDPGAARPFEALQVPVAALEHGGVEILRCAVINQGLHVTMRPVFEDTQMWGKVLADIAFQLAGVHAQQNKGQVRDILAAIRSSFEHEMNNPPEMPGGVTPPA